MTRELKLHKLRKKGSGNTSAVARRRQAFESFPFGQCFLRDYKLHSLLLPLLAKRSWPRSTFEQDSAKTRVLSRPALVDLLNPQIADLGVREFVSSRILAIRCHSVRSLDSPVKDPQGYRNSRLAYPPILRNRHRKYLSCYRALLQSRSNFGQR